MASKPSNVRPGPGGAKRVRSRRLYHVFIYTKHLITHCSHDVLIFLSVWRYEYGFQPVIQAGRTCRGRDDHYWSTTGIARTISEVFDPWCLSSEALYSGGHLVPDANAKGGIPTGVFRTSGIRCEWVFWNISVQPRHQLVSSPQNLRRCGHSKRPSGTF